MVEKQKFSQDQSEVSEPASDVEAAIEDAKASLEDLQKSVSATTGDSATADQMSKPAGAVDQSAALNLLGDVDLNVTIELGRAEMMVEDVLRLQGGSVVELDKLAGDPVDVYVNGQLVARGEVLVLNDSFCVRVSEIVANLEERVQAAAQEELSQPPSD